MINAQGAGRIGLKKQIAQKCGATGKKGKWCSPFRATARNAGAFKL